MFLLGGNLKFKIKGKYSFLWKTSVESKQQLWETDDTNKQTNKQTNK
jgi:hypothetical protein